MIVRHEILAGEERLAIENADPPVEGRGHEFLGDDQVGILEQDGELLLEFAFRTDFDDTSRKRAVRPLENAGKSQFRDDVDRIFAVQNDSFGDADVVPAQELGKIDLVRATHDRLGIVDDDQSLARGHGGRSDRYGD